MDETAWITELTAWRRHLHAHPEFGFEEKETAAFVAGKLRAMGISEIATGIGGTGLVATIRKGTSNRAIGLRADMDALRITEATGLAHASTRPGLMHACGHDGHTTIQLGAARALQDADFDGAVRLIFQPAEEWGRGMQAMLDDGLLTDFPMDEAYGLHNMPGIPAGHFATRPGPLMGAEDNFEIVLKGQGGHSARPHRARDALLAAAALVVDLQRIVARVADPAELAVVSVTELLGDGTRNALASTARVLGDCRSFSPAISQRIEAAMRDIAEGICKSHGCAVDIAYTREFVPLINDEGATAAAIAAASAVGPTDPATPPIGASEDFARLLAHVPGNFIFIGNGDSAGLHNPGYDFNDAIIAPAVHYFCRLVETRLPARS